MEKIRPGVVIAIPMHLTDGREGFGQALALYLKGRFPEEHFQLVGGNPELEEVQVMPLMDMADQRPMAAYQDLLPGFLESVYQAVQEFFRRG